MQRRRSTGVPAAAGLAPADRTVTLIPGSGPNATGESRKPRHTISELPECKDRKQGPRAGEIGVQAVL